MKGFCEEVSHTIDPDHQRRLVNSEHIEGLRGTQELDFQHEGLSARDEETEKVYFLANALIANLRLGWKSDWDPEDEIDVHNDDLKSFIIMKALRNKDGDLAWLLKDFLELVTGKNKAICGDYSATLKRLNAVKVTSDATQPSPADDFCTIA